MYIEQYILLLEWRLTFYVIALLLASVWLVLHMIIIIKNPIGAEGSKTKKKYYVLENYRSRIKT